MWIKHSAKQDLMYMKKISQMLNGFANPCKNKFQSGTLVFFPGGGENPGTVMLLSDGILINLRHYVSISRADGTTSIIFRWIK